MPFTLPVIYGDFPLLCLSFHAKLPVMSGLIRVGMVDNPKSSQSRRRRRGVSIASLGTMRYCEVPGFYWLKPRNTAGYM